MPSLLHEALVALFRNRPTLAPELLRDALGQGLPEYDDVEIKDANLSQITPTEYRADLVVLLRSDQPIFGIVVEVQLSTDEDKGFSWPLYAAALRAKLRCPTCVLVVTPDQAVANWAANPIQMGPPDSNFVPLVLGPESVPRVTDGALAKKSPELAMLSVQAHGKQAEAIEVAWATFEGLIEVKDNDRFVLYYELLLVVVSESTKRQLEARMESGTFQFKSQFAKKFRKEREEGRAEGHAKGHAKGLKEALVRVLAARGLTLTDDQQKRIDACEDVTTLDHWIDGALQAKSVDHLLQSEK